MIYFIFTILAALIITAVLFKKQVYSIVPTAAFVIFTQIIMFYVNYLYEFANVTNLKWLYLFNSAILFIIFPLFNAFVLLVYAFAILDGEKWTPSHKVSLAFGILLIIVVILKTSLLINNYSRTLEIIINIICYCSNFMSTMTLSYVLATQRYRYYRNHSTENRYDCMVVLGYRLDGAKVSKVLMDRIEMAFGYFSRHGKCLPIFLSGGKCYANKITESEAMESEFLRLGVPKKLIHREGSSSNTKENFKYVANTLKDSGIANPRILVVTNYFHMLRAVSIARSVGMNADAIGSKKNMSDPLYFKLMSREIMAFIFTQPYLVIIYVETVLLILSFAYITIK